jgi:hypothetical protein
MEELQSQAMDYIWNEARQLTEHPDVTLMAKLEIMRCVDKIQSDIRFIAPECLPGEALRKWYMLLAARKGNLDHLIVDSEKMREISELVTAIHAQVNKK